MRLLYLVNAYPRISLTFVRREIHALERLGASVVRVSVRPLEEELVDPADVAEAERTVFLLDRGAAGLIPPMLRVLLRRPLGFLRGLGAALRLGWRSETGLIWHFAYFAEACRLAEIAARERIEHVHCHFGSNPASVAMLAARIGGPGFSFTVHGPHDFEHAHAWKLPDKMEASRFTVAISHYARAMLDHVSESRCPDRVRVVRCGLDPAFLEAETAPPPEGGALLFVGRLWAQKQPLALVEAAALLRRRGVACTLRIGGDGPLRAELERRVRADGLQDSIALLGPLDGDAVRSELEGCRALVLPSAAEGLPVVLMEALALGRPVITTHVAAIPELVRDGREGWLVPAGDVEALADAMHAAVSAAPDQLARMGAGGARRVRAMHDAENSARLLLSEFRRHAGAAA